MDRRYRGADWLGEKYHGDELTQREIAEVCGVSARTIRKWMDRHDIESRDVSGTNHGLYGTARDDETRRKISKTLEGRELDDRWRRRIADSHSGNSLPDSVRERISESLHGHERPESTRRKMAESTAGEQNPMWKGGSPERYGPGWRLAKEKVRKRSDVCQNCGHDGSERRLEVHHIIPVRKFHQSLQTELSDAHDLSNLILLCTRCHRKADHGDLQFESGVEDPTQ